MAKEFNRPDDKINLEDREAAGLWKAIALSKEIGESHAPIDMDVILEIHKTIFETVMPEIAGRFRKAGEDVKKLACIEPPLGSAVGEKMHGFSKDLLYRVGRISDRPDVGNKKKHRKWLDEVFDLAAWTQHQLVAIHPFCEGNGRVARLMTNVILRRFHLPATDVKIESDDKPKYLSALCQIDNYSDYKPLRAMLISGSISTLKKEREIRRRKQAASR